ncbi:MULTISPECIES: hypothetical protein [unclassified Arthrobacter]|uniref:hypothetical protein n=1 Tax=unclassified Arthrobacter TaxID=235627 RepID=UPI0011B013AC|nr:MULTISPECIES: hypothetical protein [unclassified Arthrobacter]
MSITSRAGTSAAAIAILISQTSLISLDSNEFAADNLGNCIKVNKIDKQKITHYWKCPENDNNQETSDDEGWYRPTDPEFIEKRNAPKYKIRDFDTCIPGLETVRGCDSNPDQTACPDGSFPILRQIIGVEGIESGLVIRTYRLCPGDPFDPDIPSEDFIVEIMITPEQFRSFPITASQMLSNPENFSLRNGHSHFWAEGQSQTFNSNILETPVRIRAIPIGWNWNYGDGNTRNLDFPGEPAPEHTLRDETPTSHSYTETGTYGVGLTTLFRGEFSVDGGPWQAIPGQAAVPSDPIEIDVWRTKKQLIATD